LVGLVISVGHSSLGFDHPQQPVRLVVRLEVLGVVLVVAPACLVAFAASGVVVTVVGLWR
jgi:hypothetical protein